MLAHEVVTEGPLLRSRFIPSTFLSSWAKFLTSPELKEEQRGQPPGAERGVGKRSQGHYGH